MGGLNISLTPILHGRPRMALPLTSTHESWGILSVDGKRSVKTWNILGGLLWMVKNVVDTLQLLSLRLLLDVGSMLSVNVSACGWIIWMGVLVLINSVVFFLLKYSLRHGTEFDLQWVFERYHSGLVLPRLGSARIIHSGSSLAPANSHLLIARLMA